MYAYGVSALKLHKQKKLRQDSEEKIHSDMPYAMDDDIMIDGAQLPLNLNLAE